MRTSGLHLTDMSDSEYRQLFTEVTDYVYTGNPEFLARSNGFYVWLQRRLKLSEVLEFEAADFKAAFLAVGEEYVRLALVSLINHQKLQLDSKDKEYAALRSRVNSAFRYTS